MGLGGEPEAKEKKALNRLDELYWLKVTFWEQQSRHKWIKTRSKHAVLPSYYTGKLLKERDYFFGRGKSHLLVPFDHALTC